MYAVVCLVGFYLILLFHPSDEQKTDDFALFAKRKSQGVRGTVIDVSCMASGPNRYAPLAINVPPDENLIIEKSELQRRAPEICNFEPKAPCLEGFRRWKPVLSYDILLEDERWDDLPVINTSSGNDHIQVVKSNSVTFSFIGSGLTNIFILGYTGAFYNIYMQQDYVQIKFQTTSHEQNVFAAEVDDVLLKSEWRTWTIKHETTGRNEFTISIIDAQKKQELVKKSFSSEVPVESFSIEKVQLTSGREMKWKLHHYTAMGTTESFMTHAFGFPAKFYRYCVSLYVFLCDSCELAIQFVAGSRVVDEKTIKKTGPNWQRATLYSSEIGVTNLYLVTRYRYYETKNPYWFVDDIQECSNSDMKMIKTTVTNIGVSSLLKGINCQIIPLPSSTVRLSHLEDPRSDDLCPPGQLGPNCQFDCDEYPKHELCDYPIICSKQKCVCASGLTGPYCSQPVTLAPRPVTPPPTPPPTRPATQPTGTEAPLTLSVSSRGCAWPPKPSHGRYSPTNTTALAPAWTVLEFTCDEPYHLESSQHLVCRISRWDNPPPKCLRKCPPLVERTLSISCQKDTVSVDCTQPMFEGTVAFVDCKLNYQIQEKPYAFMTCSDGEWNQELFQCNSICGELPRVIPLITKGRNAGLNEFPWQIGVYRKFFNNFSQFCSATLITLNMAISAANCFWDGSRKSKSPVSGYALAAGKNYRNWTNERDTYAQFNTIKEIVLPTRFDGADSQFQYDIALLVLEKSFIPNTAVHPVCIDRTNTFYKDMLQVNTNGLVAGWGLIEEGGSPAEVLQATNLPFVEYKTCFDSYPTPFKPLITWDKGCAGFGNGTNVCVGDSGGGLVFLKDDKYYIQGIISVGASRNGTCDAKVHTAFTAIYKHFDWLETEIQNHRQATDTVSCASEGGLNCTPPTS